MLVTDESPIARQKGNLLPLFIYPNPILCQVSVEVTEFDQSLVQLVADLFSTMVANKGVGLSAVQTGIHKRVFVLEIEARPQYYINPKVELFPGVKLFKWEEGCLSVPGYFENRERPATISVTYQDIEGKYQSDVITGLHAFAFLHELDHLDGKVFVDDLSPLKKQIMMKKVSKTIKRRGR